VLGRLAEDGHRRDGDGGQMGNEGPHHLSSSWALWLNR
jgi:hypothetical protein